LSARLLRELVSLQKRRGFPTNFYEVLSHQRPGDGWPLGWHEESPSLSQEICPFDFSNRGAYRGCMSLAQITQEALSLPSPERRQLIARLVAAGTDEDLALKTTLAEKIDDRRAENWVALADLKKQFKDL
jgi:hypothetical protein